MKSEHHPEDVAVVLREMGGFFDEIQARELLVALDAARAARGLVLVPLEPTQEMCRLGDTEYFHDGSANSIYQVMLAARPKEGVPRDGKLAHITRSPAAE